MAESIVVVEDDPVIQRLPEKPLGASGYAVRGVRRGDEAIRAVSSGAGR